MRETSQPRHKSTIISPDNLFLIPPKANSVLGCIILYASTICSGFDSNYCIDKGEICVCFWCECQREKEREILTSRACLSRHARRRSTTIPRKSEAVTLPPLPIHSSSTAAALRREKPSLKIEYLRSLSFDLEARVSSSKSSLAEENCEEKRRPLGFGRKEEEEEEVVGEEQRLRRSKRPSGAVIWLGLGVGDGIWTSQVLHSRERIH